MSGFLNVGRSDSHRWLSSEQPSTQAQQSEQGLKPSLRASLRDKRKNLKDTAVAEGGNWGLDQRGGVFRFLNDRGVLTKKPITIAAYWPIDSELNLLAEPNAAADVSGREADLKSISMPPTEWLLPVARPQRQLRWFRISPDIVNWNRDKSGLPKPPDNLPTWDCSASAQSPWIVLTPCLAVDHTGVRLGYGGGYYDELIARYGNNCLLIACVPSALFLEQELLPREAHDMPVDVIITENSSCIVDSSRFGKKLKLFR